MAGGIYTALSGMHTRLASLDRLASDIANASTAGYKAERASTNAAERPLFDEALESAIDVTDGKARLDFRSGVLTPTGRSMDVALEGNGFFVLDTPAGTRFTRNGSFVRRQDGVLATREGEDALMGEKGPIKIGTGDVTVDADGSVREDGAVVGKLRVVDFPKTDAIVRESAVRLRNDGMDPAAVEHPSIKTGALEQSNVSVAERLVDLTVASRNFEGLQRALSLLVNDVDGRAISELGRR
jgi:flagellar basal body rod protein FlgG